jgi:hypothetical protein
MHVLHACQQHTLGVLHPAQHRENSLQAAIKIAGLMQLVAI